MFLFRSKKRLQNSDESGKAVKLNEVIKPTKRNVSPTKAQLIEEAKSKGIKVTTKMTKAEIENALKNV